MRVFGSVLAALTVAYVSAAPVAGHVVTCSISNYNDHPYSRSTLQGLIPERQTHRIEGTTARFGDATGLVTQDDESRLKWRYNVTLSQQSGMTATLSYTIIRPSGMLIVRVYPGGSSGAGSGLVNPVFEFAVIIDDTGEQEYVPVDRVTGACAET
jgi:hypothetical protein